MNGINLRQRVTILEGLSLKYGVKSPDMDLYDLGFGRDLVFRDKFGKPHNVCQYVIHIVCGIRLFWKDGRREEYTKDSSYLAFQNSIHKFIGEPIRRVALSEKNDLWLDFGQCSMAIITHEDADESWRLFAPYSGNKHLVATNIRLCLE